MNLLSLLNRWFSCEEINGANRCPTYLYRWRLLSTPWFKIYLHRFVGEDWSRDLHDHPKRFISIGLAGGYIEQTPGGYTIYRAPWIRSFPPEHTHRVSLLRDGRECWTLVVVLGAVRSWGFWHAGRWIHWREYVSSQIADEMKSCGEG